MLFHYYVAFTVIISRIRIPRAQDESVSHRTLDHQDILQEAWRCATHTPFQEGTLYPAPKDTVSCQSKGVSSFMSASAFAPRSCPSQGGIKQILSKTMVKDPW